MQTRMSRATVAPLYAFLIAGRMRRIFGGTLFFLLACASEDHYFYGPTFVDQAGVDLTSPEAVAIEGASNRLELFIPEPLHPDAPVTIADSTWFLPPEFHADVYLTSGRIYTFSAHGQRVEPAYLGRIVDLVPDDGAKLTGSVVRITLRSARPSVVSKIRWESWNQGM